MLTPIFWVAPSEGQMNELINDVWAVSFSVGPPPAFYLHISIWMLKAAYEFPASM